MFSAASVNGIKTGHTLGAGYVLVASAERGGIPLISVVLGAASEAERDADSEQLLDYGYSLYRPRVAVREGEELGTIPVTEGDPESLTLTAGRSYRVTARSDQQLDLDLEAPAAVEGPIAAGEKLGSADVLLDGDRVGTVPVVAAAGIAAPTWIDQVGGPLAVLLIAGGSILLIIASVIALRRSGRLRPPVGRERTMDERLAQGRRRSRYRQENDAS
jgi:D-alanyl-D-alanine carboxypeptidase (penicillin-binding protein 5/6)